MRAILLAIGLALISAPAFAFDDPAALVQAIYSPYQVAGQAAAQDPTQYYSERLRGLVTLHADKAKADQMAAAAAGADNVENFAPGLSFNPFIDAQHSLLMDLAITTPVVMGEKASVMVSFHNFDHANLLTLSLVKDPDGWKVDDVASLGEGENWLLSWLLQYDPFEVK